MATYNLTAAQLKGEGILNSFEIPSSGGGSSLLLDTYQNAAIAYSLRKLSSTFSGDPIRVRRSNDNAEQDIPFDGNGDLDTTNLLAFVGSNDGFITKWYDQSGNSNDAYRTTATLQAQIVSSGTVETDSVNNKPTSVWSADTYTLTNTLTTTMEYYLITVLRRSTNLLEMNTLGRGTSNAPRILSWASNGSGNFYRSAMRVEVNFGSSSSVGTFILETYRESDGGMFLFRDQVQQGGHPTTSQAGGSLDKLDRWGQRSTVTTTGEYQEIIYWPNDMFNNKADIYTDLNTYYQ